MQDGYGAPFVSCYYKNILIQDRVESFKYSSSEDDGEDCEVNIRLDNPSLLDLPQYQEGVQWKIIWGYIGGKKSHPRKVYCYEVKPEFDDQNILLTISFNEKGISLKQRASKQIHTNTNIVEILHKAGKTHGLKTSIEVLDNKGNPIKIITSDELIKNMKDLAEKKAARDAEDTTLFGSTDDDLLQRWQDGNIVDPSAREGLKNLLAGIGLYHNIAQGNKTDKQLLDELGKRQPGGQYILDTTDDEATLKQRNFNQKPVRSYSYGLKDGELQAFQPESKGKSKKGSSTNINYGGWDAVNKTYYNGDTNASNEPTPLSAKTKATLAKYQAQYDKLNQAGDDSKVLGFTTVRLESSLRSDATRRVQILPQPITILDKKTALKKTIDFFNNPDGNSKPIDDPTSSSPGDSLGHASNLRDEAELKMNPGYFEAVGDPDVLKGKIITFLGVSKKYSGNYYITKIEHVIDGQKPYMIHGDLVRQGHNIKTNNQYKNTLKLINTKIGANSTKTRTKQIPVKTNP